jgi:hypothetical protein
LIIKKNNFFRIRFKLRKFTRNNKITKPTEIQHKSVNPII